MRNQRFIAGARGFLGLALAVTAAANVGAAPAPAAVARQSLPKAKPANDPSVWITSDDYPPASRRANQEGLVSFTLWTDQAGRVAKCTIDQSSGFTDLDAATCAMLTRRARFTPVSSTQGSVFSGKYSGRTKWQIEHEAAPASQFCQEFQKIVAASMTEPQFTPPPNSEIFERALNVSNNRCYPQMVFAQNDGNFIKVLVFQCFDQFAQGVVAKSKFENANKLLGGCLGKVGTVEQSDDGPITVYENLFGTKATMTVRLKVKPDQETALYGSEWGLQISK